MSDPLPIQPLTRPLRGTVFLPGSKSITNRALLLAALTEQRIILTGALFSRDTTLMVENLARLGFAVTADAVAGTIELTGTGGRLPRSTADLHVGNAGTAARFLTALLALAPSGEYRLDGDPAMRERPMEGLLEALADQGCRFLWEGQPGRFPFRMQPAGLRGGEVAVDASASSQLLSALLLVAPRADAEMTVRRIGATVSEPFVGMTLRLLAQFGVRGLTESDRYCFAPTAPHLPGGVYAVEGDATAASYFVALPLAAGGQLTIANYPGSDHLQGDAAFAEVLQAEGLIDLQAMAGKGVVVRPGPRRAGFSRDFNDISDTFLTLAALSPLLESPLTLGGIGHTRFQETDRIVAAATELARLGQTVSTTRDSLTVIPDRAALCARAREARAAEELLTVQTYEDHRVAMSFAILGLADLLGDGRPWLQIADPQCCRKTFPDFFAVLDRLRQPARAPGGAVSL